MLQGFRSFENMINILGRHDIWPGISGIFLRTLAFLFLIWLYKELTLGICYLKRNLAGTVALIVQSGHGNTKDGQMIRIAEKLATYGAKVAILSASEDKCLIETKGKLDKDGNIHFLSLEDWRSENVLSRFASNFQTKFRKLNILIVLDDFQQDQKSDWLFSFWNKFLITESLRPLMEETAAKQGDIMKSRIIFDRFEFHWLLDRNRVTVGDVLHNDPGHIGFLRSHLATSLYWQKLTANWKITGVESMSVHSGFLKNFAYPFLDENWRMILKFWMYFMGKSDIQACQSILQAVQLEDNGNGKFLRDCRDSWLAKQLEWYNDNLITQFYLQAKKSQKSL